VHLVRIYGTGPPEWGVILSELFHDLRSALDNLMWELVLANGQTAARASSFPIHQKRNDDDVRTKTAGASNDAVQVIADLQPYRAARAGMVHHHPLFLVHKLNRLDKHRTPHGGHWAVDQGEWYVPPEEVGITGHRNPAATA
jgi:hypothetical protein